MKNKYLRSFLHFFSANFIARFISLFKEVVLALFLGPGRILDIYFFIIAVPEFIKQIWTRPLETILLKKYEEQTNKYGLPAAKKNLSQHLNNLTIISFLIYCVSSATFPLVIYFFYFEYYIDSIVLAIVLVNFSLVVETYILSIRIIKYSENNFFLPTIIPVFQSITILTGLFIFRDKVSLLVLSLLFFIGSLLQTSILFRKEFSGFLFLMSQKIKIFKEKFILKNVAQLSLAAGLSSLNVLIDQAFALKIGKAANSYIHYGYYFLSIYSFLFVRNINTVLFPQFQKYVVQKKHDQLISDVQKVFKIILIISLVSSVLIINNGHFVLNLLLGYGKVSPDDLLIIYYCTLGYTGAFLGTAMNAVIVRILHVYAEYRILIYVAIINFIINIIFNFIFIQIFGVWGIALSTSVAFLVLIILYVFYLKIKRNMNFFMDTWWYIKYLLIAIIILFLEVYLLLTTEYFINLSIKDNIILIVVSVSILSLLLLLSKLVSFKNKRLSV